MVRGTISGKDQLLGIHALVIFWKICQVRNSNTYALNTFGKWLTKDFGLTATAYDTNSGIVSEPLDAHCN